MKREKKLFIGCFNKSVILTYIGVIFALAGIFILIDLAKNSIVFFLKDIQKNYGEDLRKK